MKSTLEMMNRMQADGIIDRYAIGGAVGATFYLEPAATFDIDIFVVLPTTAAGSFRSESFVRILDGPRVLHRSGAHHCRGLARAVLASWR